MTSNNPFSTGGHEDSVETDILFPGIPSLNNVQTNPPRNYEMTPMQFNPRTRPSYMPAPAGKFGPAHGSSNLPSNVPLMHFTGDGSGPSAPSLHSPSPTLPYQAVRDDMTLPSSATGIYPQLKPGQAEKSTAKSRNSQNNGCSHSEIIPCSHSEMYRNKIDQAKTELKNYIDDLHHKLNAHYVKLLKQLDAKQEKNIPTIEEKQRLIASLDKIESGILKSEGAEKSNEKLKDVLAEQKRELESEIASLSQIHLYYKEEPLGDLEEMVRVLPTPVSANTHPLDNEVRVDSETIAKPKREQDNVGVESTSYSATDKSRTFPPGPIIHNIQLGHDVEALLDPTGLVVDRNNSDLIYVADKEKHRVQVFDRSGCYLKTIAHSEEMRHPHSLGVSGKFLFILCAADTHQFQYVLKFNKYNGKYLGKLSLKDIRHIPLSTYEDTLYMATSNSMVEKFDLDLNWCGKIDVKLEKRSNVASIFSGGPEIRDICAKNDTLYLLVLKSDHAIQIFSFNGDLRCLLAPNSELSDPYYFTVDNRDNVFVTEGREGRVKLFKRNGKSESFDCAYLEGSSEKITKPMGIDVDSKGKVVICCAQKEWVLKEI